MVMAAHTQLSALNPHSSVRLFPDDEFRIVNASDTSKQLAFDLSAITTGTTRTVAVPDANGTMALLERAQTFTKLATFALGLTVGGAAFASRGIQDDATARALALSGSGACHLSIANGAASVAISTLGGPTVPLLFDTLGGAYYSFKTNTYEQVRIEHAAGANNHLKFKGANGSDPSIATSGGRLWLNNTNVFVGGTPGNALQYLDVYNGDTGALAGSTLRLITSDAAGTGQTTGHLVKYKTGAMYLANNENSAAGLLGLSTYATASVALYTRNLTSPGLEIVDSGGVNARWAQILGSATGNPKIKPSGGNLVLGAGVALATTATDGYVMIPTCAGAPTGVPTNAGAGQLPLIYDSTNNKIYAYNGAWKATAALT